MTARRFASRRRSFGGNQSGVVAIEFAIVLPIMLVLLLGTFELSKYIQTNNQVVQTVAMVGQMASQMPGSSTVADAQRIWSAAPLIAPESRKTAARMSKASWSDVLSVTISSIVFKKRDASCNENCVYDGYVAWSVGQTPIACGKVPPGAALQPIGVAIPDEIYGPGSVLFVGSTLPYQPYLGGTLSILGDLGNTLTTTMSEASWFLPRNATSITLSTAGAGSTPSYRICPGVSL